jgi:hypothetical protein
MVSLQTAYAVVACSMRMAPVPLTGPSTVALAVFVVMEIEGFVAAVDHVVVFEGARAVDFVAVLALYLVQVWA